MRLRLAHALLVPLLFHYPGHATDIEATIAESSISTLLSNPSIHDIFVDRFDHIWLSTLDGLLVFDGAGAVHFSPTTDKKNTRDFPSRNVFEIFEDREGGLWAATTDAGIWKLDRNTGDFFQPTYIADDTIPKTGLTSVFVDSAGAIWLGYKDQGIKIIYEKWEVVRNLSDDYYELGVSGFGEDHSGKIWVATTRSDLLRFTLNGEEEARVSISNLCNTDEQRIKWFSIIGNGDAWIGTGSGHLYNLDVEHKSCRSFSSLSHNSSFSGKMTVHDAVTIDDGLIVLATDVGLLGVSNGALSFHYSSKNSKLVDSEITAIARDSSDNYWIGTHSGFFTFRNSEFPTTKQLPKDLRSAIVGFAERPGSGFWIASYNDIFFRSDTLGELTPINVLLPELPRLDGRIMAVASSTNTLWIGLRSDGVRKIALEESTVTRFHKRSDQPIGSDEITKIKVLKDGNVLVGSFGSGLSLIAQNNTTEVFQGRGAPETLQADYIFDILELPSGLVLLGTENGLFAFDRKSNIFQSISLMTNLSSTPKPIIVWGIRYDDYGNLWIGTHGNGLFRTLMPKPDTKSLVLQKVAASGIDDAHTIYALEVDQLNNVWTASNVGLCRLSTSIPKTLCFGVEHGLASEELDFGASLLGSNGELFFGGSGGFNSFSPRQIEGFNRKPALSFSEIRVDSTRLMSTPMTNRTEPLQLPYSHRSLNIRFSLVDYLNITENQFTYKMHNFDAKWSPLHGVGQATYTSLPTGNFVFEAKGLNSAGIWNDRNLVLPIRVHSPPWQTVYYYLTLLFMVASAGFFVALIYKNYLLRQKAEFHALQMERTADFLMDSLEEEVGHQSDIASSIRKQANRSLELMHQASRLQAQTDSCSDSFTVSFDRHEATMLIQSYLHQRGGILFVDLYAYTAALLDEMAASSNLESHNLLFTNSVTKQLFPEESATYIALAIYELVDNCFKHAFKDQRPPYYIGIDLTKTGYDELELPTWILGVSDSGVGLSDDQVSKTPQTAGYKILQALCDHMDGKLVIESPVHGSRVSITHE